MSGSINDTDIGVMTPAIGNFSSLGIDGAYTFVSTPGSVGQVLSSNGNGTTSWATPSSGPTDLSEMSVVLSSANLALSIPFTNDIIPFNTVVSGQTGWADTTNHRIKPTVPGVYLISFSIWFSSTPSSETTTSVAVNNSILSWYITTTPFSFVGDSTLHNSVIVNLNGTTDYVDLRLSNNLSSGTVYCALTLPPTMYKSYLMATKIG